MKPAEIMPGTYAVTKVSGKDQPVIVIGESNSNVKPQQYIVRTPAGNLIYRTARQLRKG